MQVLQLLYGNVVGIVNGCGLGIDMRLGNGLNKSKLTLYKALIHCKIY